MGFKEAREKTGLSQRAAGAQLGVSGTAVCNWESGAAYPEAKKLREIAKLYGCTVDELLPEEEAE